MFLFVEMLLLSNREFVICRQKWSPFGFETGLDASGGLVALFANCAADCWSLSGLKKRGFECSPNQSQPAFSWRNSKWTTEGLPEEKNKFKERRKKNLKNCEPADLPRPTKIVLVFFRIGLGRCHLNQIGTVWLSVTGLGCLLCTCLSPCHICIPIKSTFTNNRLTNRAWWAVVGVVLSAKLLLCKKTYCNKVSEIRIAFVNRGQRFCIKCETVMYITNEHDVTWLDWVWIGLCACA